MRMRSSPRVCTLVLFIVSSIPRFFSVFKVSGIFSAHIRLLVCLCMFYCTATNLVFPSVSVFETLKYYYLVTCSFLCVWTAFMELIHVFLLFRTFSPVLHVLCFGNGTFVWAPCFYFAFERFFCIFLTPPSFFGCLQTFFSLLHVFQCLHSSHGRFSADSNLFNTDLCFDLVYYVFICFYVEKYYY